MILKGLKGVPIVFSVTLLLFSKTYLINALILERNNKLDSYAIANMASEFSTMFKQYMEAGRDGEMKRK